MNIFKKIGDIWGDLLEHTKIPKDGVVVEIAPGDTPKIGLGLKSYGFYGILYLVEPEPDSMFKLIQKYNQLLPNVTIVPLVYKLEEALIQIPNNPDAVLSNHPLDDMIIGMFLEDEKFCDFLKIIILHLPRLLENFGKRFINNL